MMTTGAPRSTKLTTSRTAVEMARATVARPLEGHHVGRPQEPLLLMAAEDQPVVGDRTTQEHGGQSGQ